MIRPPRLSRRTFLRGAGAAIALPMLEAMLPRGPRGAAYASEFEVPRRLLYYFVPNGMHMPSWTPTTAGADFALPLILEPLAPYREDVLVLTRLSNRAGIDTVAGDHARGTAACLTARTAGRSESDLSLGISVDQVAANAIGRHTRWPSLQLGLDTDSPLGQCDSGYSCAYSNNISWADADTPLPKITSPYVLYERLFGTDTEGLDDRAVARRRLYRQSVLDLALEDAASLHSRLGSADRAKLDEYFTAVRELETRLDSVGDTSACGTLEIPNSVVSDPTLHAQLMNELMVMALRCDQSRIFSFMLGNGGSPRMFAFLGVFGLHHEISHHQDREENFRMLETIDRWEMEQFAHLIGLMKASTEADGQSLLDHSLVCLTSEIGDGNAHNHDHIPTLLCGRGGGAVRPGRHVVYETEQPIARLYVSMLQAAGVEVETFGVDGDGPIDGLS